MCYSLEDKCLKIPQFEGAVVCGQERPHPHHIDTYLLDCVRGRDAHQIKLQLGRIKGDFRES